VVAGPGLAPQGGELAPHRAPAQRALDREHQRLERERLDHEVGGAGAQGLDGEVDVGARGEQDDEQVGPAIERGVQQLGAGGPREG
jgi:hypothetical protein